MKREEVTKPCACCSEKMGKGITFYRVSIERFILDHGAIQRQAGLEIQVGSPVLASVMGPDEDLAKPVSKKIKVLICEDCALREQSIAIINETESEKTDESEG